jgi:RNA polymerase sigma-32 factor
MVRKRQAMVGKRASVEDALESESEKNDQAYDRQNDQADQRENAPEDGPEDENDDGSVLPAASDGPLEVIAEPELLPGRGRENGDLEERRGGLEPLRNPLHRFLAETRRYPRLTDEEEKRLIREVREQADTRAARTLVVHNLRLVVSIAYQYRQAWTNVLDLIQEGSVGLLEAVKHWDPTLGTRFGSYAAYWIRAYILKFLMTNARLIHVGNTRAGRKLFFRLERERQKLLAGGFDPTPKLLAAKLDVAESDVEEVSAHLAAREISIDPRPDDEGIALEERLPGGGGSPETEAARSELSGAVAGLMRQFAGQLTDERERAIWHEHLSASEDPISLGTLGQRFGVSKQRMGQIADKLKKRFREEILKTLGSDIQLEWQRGVD